MKQDEDGTFVILHQPETEIYWGQGGQIILQQDQAYQPYADEHDYPRLAFTPAAARQLIRALQARLREYDDDAEQEETPPVGLARAAVEPPIEKPGRAKGKA